MLLVQAEGLDDLRAAVLAAAEFGGLVYDDTYPCWIPHITIGPTEIVSVEMIAGLRGVTIAPPSLIVGFGSDDWREVDLPKVGLPYGNLETAPDGASSDDGAGTTSVTAMEASTMICDTCKAAAHTAVSAPVTTQPTTDAGDLESRVAALEAEVADLKSMVMTAAMASLSPLPMPALV